MTDEFGCSFLDAAFGVTTTRGKTVGIQQIFEMEKDKILSEYPLEHPEYALVFDQYFYAEEHMKDPEYQLDVESFLQKHDRMERENGDILLGFVLFRAYIL